MIAFWICRRFSASSHTRLCGPSMTPLDTSSPRCAGRQWRKIALLSAVFINFSSTVTRERALALLLLLLLTHRRPHVRVDDMRVLRRLQRIADDADLRHLLRA